MSHIRVTITDQASNRTQVELPKNTPVEKFLPILAAKLHLPHTQHFQAVRYKLRRLRDNKLLDDNDTLITAEIQSEDEFVIVQEYEPVRVEEFDLENNFVSPIFGKVLNFDINSTTAKIGIAIGWYTLSGILLSTLGNVTSIFFDTPPLLRGLVSFFERPSDFLLIVPLLIIVLSTVVIFLALRSISDFISITRLSIGAVFYEDGTNEEFGKILLGKKSPVWVFFKDIINTWGFLLLLQLLKSIFSGIFNF